MMSPSAVADAVIDAVLSRRSPAKMDLHNRLLACILILRVRELAKEDQIVRLLFSDIIEKINQIYPGRRSLLPLVDFVCSLKQLDPFIVDKQIDSVSLQISGIFETILKLQKMVDFVLKSVRGDLKSVSGVDFFEEGYLLANPDVAHAVATGGFKSGRDHFDILGAAENRMTYILNAPEVSL